MDNRVNTQWIALRPGIGVGVAILAGWTRVGAYVASAWLLGVAANLVAAGFYDVAVRDVVMSLAAFTLARMAELRVEAPVYGYNTITGRPNRQVTALQARNSHRHTRM